MNLKELFDYRDLFLILAYRDLRVRYAQTFLGFTWALLQPLMTLAIFTLVFRRFANIDTQGIPYPAFVLAGMCCWVYFSFVMNQSGASILGAQEMVKKIYFPRLIIPLSKAVVGLVDLGVSLLLLLLVVIYYAVPLSSNFVFLPLVLLITIFSSLGVGIWLSALTIRYRDFQHVTPFITQLGLYITPVAYPSELVLSSLGSWGAILYYLNPMAGIVDAMRWTLFGTHIEPLYILVSALSGISLFLLGTAYFKKVERIMADIL